MQSPIFESHAMFVHKGIAIIKYDPNTIMCIVQCTLFQHIQIWVNIKNLNKFYRDIMICVVVVVFYATNVDYCCCLKHTNFKWFQRRWWFSLIFYGSTQAKKTFSYSNLWRAYRVWMHYKKWNTISENKFHVCEMYCVLAYRVPKKMQTYTSYCVCTGFPSFRFGTTTALNTLHSKALYASVRKWEKWLTNFVRRATKRVYK